MAPYSVKNMLFTRVAPRTKSKGLPIGGPLPSKKYAFYTRSTAYKKQGAPDRRSLSIKILEWKNSKIPIGISKYFLYTVSSMYRKQGAFISIQVFHGT
jgi:hypothetical protein